jgi:hypothetical protein
MCSPIPVAPGRAEKQPTRERDQAVRVPAREFVDTYECIETVRERASS